MGTTYQQDEVNVTALKAAVDGYRDALSDLEDLQRLRVELERQGFDVSTTDAILTAHTDVIAVRITAAGVLVPTVGDAIKRIVPGAPPQYRYLIIARAEDYEQTYLMPSPSPSPSAYEPTALSSVISANDVVKLVGASNRENEGFMATVLAAVDMINNGTFANTDNWAIEGGAWATEWTLTGNKARHAAGNTAGLRQYAANSDLSSSMAFAMLPGYRYNLSFTISNTGVGGAMSVRVGTDEGSYEVGQWALDGTVTDQEIYCPLGDNAYIEFLPESTSVMDIDGVTLKPRNWILLDARAPQVSTRDERCAVYLTYED